MVYYAIDIGVLKEMVLFDFKPFLCDITSYYFHVILQLLRNG